MLIRIQVKPNSKTDSISIDNGGIIQVKIRAEPIEGKANKYLLKYLSNIFRLSKSKIEIIKGHSSFYKTIALQVDEDYVNNILKSFRDKCATPARARYQLQHCALLVQYKRSDRPGKFLSPPSLRAVKERT
jgi:uncharacterized protein (TIGR00251 family)